MKSHLACFMIASMLMIAGVTARDALPDHSLLVDRNSQYFASTDLYVPIGPASQQIYYYWGQSSYFDSTQLDLDSRRAVAAVITLTSSDTNATLVSYLCNNLTATDTTVKVTSANQRFLLPDCFFNQAKAVISIEFQNIIIQGNSSFPDPLVRLALAISSTPITFELSSCFLLTPSGENATIDWDAISIVTLSVSRLVFLNTYLGIGATLPTFPRPLLYLDLGNTGLTGTLPASLFATSAPTVGSFHFSASSNALTGSIPSTFLANLPLGPIGVFSFYISTNSLNGTIPASLLAGPFPSCFSMNLNFGFTNLEGNLEDLIVPTSLDPAVITSFYFHGSSTNFTGPTPTWFDSMPLLNSFTFYCDECQLQSLSPSFLATSTIPCVYTVSISYNQLSGDIPSTFLQLLAAPRVFSLSLRGNNLTGMPPLATANFTNTPSVSINFVANKLSGVFPTSPGLLGMLNTDYYLWLESNPTLTSTIPSSFLSAFGSTNSSLKVTLYLGSTGLSGDLALPDMSLAPNIRFTIEATSTNFTSLTIPECATSGLVYLKLTGSQLTGQLPASLFINNPNMATLNVPQSLLIGSMPDMGTSNPTKLIMLNLASATMDFCSGTRSNWTSSTLSTCVLTNTNAYYCQEKYPSQCSFSVPPPLALNSVPEGTCSPTPNTSPSECSPSTRPSPEWICIGGTWTFPGSINSTTIVIPSGATTTTIKGNLTSSTVIINGLNSIIIVDGCTSNTTIIVELTPQQLEEIGRDGKLQQLLSFSNTSMCNSSTSDVTIATHVKGSSCQTVSVSKVPSSNGSFSGLFTVNKSGCNKWWIILVSVIAGVVVLGLVAAIIVYTLHHKRANRRHQATLRKG